MSKTKRWADPGYQAPICIYPECTQSRRTRGLCHSHYQTLHRYLTSKPPKASEADLMSRGLLLPTGGGGSKVPSLDGLLLGSTMRGKGA